MQWQRYTRRLRLESLYELISASLSLRTFGLSGTNVTDQEYTLLEMAPARESSDGDKGEDVQIEALPVSEGGASVKGIGVDGRETVTFRSATLEDAAAADVDNPLFVRNLVYTRSEEAAVVRILDTWLFPWILLTTFVLNMDRTNNSNAISDNLPEDLGFSINVVNTATAIYSVLFSIFCLTGAVIAKIAGPSRCTSCISY